jgi:hypothetical protein
MDKVQKRGFIKHSLADSQMTRLLSQMNAISIGATLSVTLFNNILLSEPRFLKQSVSFRFFLEKFFMQFSLLLYERPNLCLIT